MGVCMCVGGLGGWDKQSSTENGMCKDPGAGNSHSVGYISTLFIPAFIQ